jgi:hypothetical protein
MLKQWSVEGRLLNIFDHTLPRNARHSLLVTKGFSRRDRVTPPRLLVLWERVSSTESEAMLLNGGGYPEHRYMPNPETEKM